MQCARIFTGHAEKMPDKYRAVICEGADVSRYAGKVVQKACISNLFTITIRIIPASERIRGSKCRVNLLAAVDSSAQT